MATESHHKELKELLFEQGRTATVEVELSRTIGEVPAAFAVAGNSVSLLVVQASGAIVKSV